MQVHRPSQPRMPRASSRYAVKTADDEAREWRRAGWAAFWFLVLGKLVTMIVIAAVGLAMHTPAERTFAVVVLWNWSWIALAAVLVAGPTAYWLRLRRVRRKRAALIRAEWRVD